MAIAIALCFGCARHANTPKIDSAIEQNTQNTSPSNARNSETVKSAGTNNTMPSTPPAETVTQADTIAIASRARVSFCMESVEGILYDVYIVGENEERLDKWVWRQHDNEEEIWCGAYYAYIKPQDATEPVMQSVYLFDEENTHHATQKHSNLGSA